MSFYHPPIAKNFHSSKPKVRAEALDDLDKFLGSLSAMDKPTIDNAKIDFDDNAAFRCDLLRLVRLMRSCGGNHGAMFFIAAGESRLSSIAVAGIDRFNARWVAMQAMPPPAR